MTTALPSYTTSRDVTPETEPFESRARILFQRQSGRHIDYIVMKLHENLEPYTETVIRTIVIREYHDVEGKFRIEQSTDSIVRAYVDDKEVPFKALVSYKNGTQAPRGKPKSALAFIRVASEPHSHSEEFDTEFIRHFEGLIPMRGSCLVETKLSFWVREGSERNTHAPARYTQVISLKMENQIRVPVVVQVKASSGSEKRYELRPGESRILVTEKDVKPTQTVYDYAISKSA